MTDIHAIIADAKLVGRPEECAEDSDALLTLHCNAIAMAETLIRVDALLANGRYGDAAMVIGDCLDKIVKEVQ